MTKRILIIIMLIAMMGFLSAEEEFIRIEQWNHGDQELYVGIDGPLIDKDGHMVAYFGKLGARLITPDNVTAFAPLGQGPSDAYLVCGICQYNDDIAFVELYHKIKIFTKKGNTYAWKATNWLKRDYYPQIIRDVIFFKDKWFLAGDNTISEKGEKFEKSLIKVFDSAGKPIKVLIERVYNGKNAFHQMDHYIVHNNKDRVFFLAENELKVYVICPDKLEILKEVNLEIPAFYKKMPDDFYVFKLYENDSRDFYRDYQKWKTSYSRIVRVKQEGNYLAIQIRTFGEKQKKFAVLFYNVDTFKLEKIFSTDDLFLATRDGKYYFYANGNPGYDEGTDNCIINIYAFKEKK